MTDYSDPGSVASRLRQRRALQLVSVLAEVHARRGQVSVLDLGGTRQYWSSVGDEVLQELDVTVVIVNVVVPDAPDADRFAYLQGDACDLTSLADDSFDLVHANSVIEHVGDWPRMHAFAGEARRLAPRLYIQTPNFWFPIEPHFGVPLFHWLPEQSRVRLFMRFDLGHGRRSPDVAHATVRAQSARLLSHRQMQALFPDATITVERLGPFPKSLIAIR